MQTNRNVTVPIDHSKIRIKSTRQAEGTDALRLSLKAPIFSSISLAGWLETTGVAWMNGEALQVFGKSLLRFRLKYLVLRLRCLQYSV